MKKHEIASILMLTFSSLLGFAQVNTENINANAPSVSSDNGNSETRKIYKRKGNLYGSWGYNRAFYSKSNIHLTGDGYDFTITNLTARDQPGGHDFLTYIKPTMFTIPQFNFRFGYFLTDKTFVTFGHDHMKYNMDKQATLLTGTITEGVHSGTYNNTDVLVGENAESGVYQPDMINSLPAGFVSEFEHCDGLNDFSFELGHLEQLWIAPNCKHAFSAVGTIASGMMIPDSDTDVLGHEPRHDMEAGKKAYHLAGYSLSASVGLQFDFFKHFFLLGKLKAGYINMPDILTTVEGGRASQHFNFIEPMMLLGYSHSICKH